jgi:hypothetical protein
MRRAKRPGPVKTPMPRVLNSEIILLIGEAKRHAREIYGDDTVIAANRILAVWLWHAVRGSSPTFLPKPPKRKRRNDSEGAEAR